MPEFILNPLKTVLHFVFDKVLYTLAMDRPAFLYAIHTTAAIAAMILYTLVATGRTELSFAARSATKLAILGTLVACVFLLYNIFYYHFEINYVYEHASRKLSKFLLFSTFYASQEGSFMLWGLWTSIIAAFLIGYARRQRYEAHVMAIFLSVLVFISIMLLAKSPFETIYAANPGEAMKGFIPADGKGLNPSLENLWIVIHPPMLFFGILPACSSIRVRACGTHQTRLPGMGAHVNAVDARRGDGAWFWRDAWRILGL